MVQTTGIVLGSAAVLVAVVLHYVRGTGWQPSEDISQQVLENRAESVPETEFPEPYNRGIGGGGAPAGAIGGGESEGELEDSDDEDAGFDPSAIGDDEVEYYEIEFANEGETIEVANNENLLEAGEDEGWDLPYACRQGQCVSCAGRITSGGNSEDYVVHDDQSMLDDSELGEGYTLTCVAYPRADFAIETGEAP